MKTNSCTILQTSVFYIILTVVSSVLAVFVAVLPTNIFVSNFLTLSPPDPKSVMDKQHTIMQWYNQCITCKTLKHYLANSLNTHTHVHYFKVKKCVIIYL